MAGKSEATKMLEALDRWRAAQDGWDAMEDAEFGSGAEVELSRGGRLFKPNPDKGDGYWCPEHKACYGCENRRWGKFGAAGVLFFHRETKTFLLNLRSSAIHHGGTWGTVGGAIDRNETPFEGAMREASEELGGIPTEYEKVTEQINVTAGAHGDWQYTTFVVEVAERFELGKADWETQGNEWVTLQEMASMKLHPGFKRALPAMLTEMFMQGRMR